ncbi:MAG: hypothetical protein FWC80_01220 [Firmicutes bacterium]|nr:hypothetical protein [Bacillota bacterium]
MAVLEKIRTALNGISMGYGKYSENPIDATGIYGKVIFAGGKHLPDEDKPRNVMGGAVLPVEVFKVVLKGEDYSKLEDYLNDRIKTALKNEGFIQISGFEHIDGDTMPQLAVSFKSVN